MNEIKRELIVIDEEIHALELKVGSSAPRTRELAELTEEILGTLQNLHYRVQAIINQISEKERNS